MRPLPFMLLRGALNVRPFSLFCKVHRTRQCETEILANLGVDIEAQWQRPLSSLPELQFSQGFHKHDIIILIIIILFSTYIGPYRWVSGST